MCCLVGYSQAAEGYLDRVMTHPEWGYIVNGILADNVPDEYSSIEVLKFWEAQKN